MARNLVILHGGMGAKADRAVRAQLDRAIGYARGEAPLGYAEPKDDLLVEYDVARMFDHESATDRGDEFPEWVP